MAATGLLAGPVQAQAGYYHLLCSRQVATYLTPVITEPQGVAVGERLTDWAPVGSSAECQATTIEPYADPPPPPDARITRLYTDQLSVQLHWDAALAGIAPVMADGQLHTVYTVPYGIDGLGYILQVRPASGGAWSALNLTPGSVQVLAGHAQEVSYSPAVDETHWEWFEVDYRVALVKTGEVDPDEFELWWPDFPFIQDNFRVATDTDTPGVEYPPEENAWGDGWVFFSKGNDGEPLPDIEAPCMPYTPGVTHVTLDPASLTEFAGPGSTAREQSFVLSWYCFAPGDGIPQFQFMDYQFLIASGKPSPDAGQGVLPQEHPSGAQGVGIQVLIDHNTSSPFVPSGIYAPIEFGVTKTLNAAAGQWAGEVDFELHMKARYYKTAEPMTAGSVEAGLTVVMTVH